MKLEYSINNYFNIKKKTKDIAPFMMYYIQSIMDKENENNNDVENEKKEENNINWCKEIYNNPNNKLLLDYEKKHNINYLESMIMNTSINNRRNENNNINDID